MWSDCSVAPVESYPKTELPGGWLAARRGEYLELRAPQPEPALVGYEYTLPIPGEVHISEIGLTVRAVIIREEFAQESGDRTVC